ncbi:MAG: hypothetical protein GTN76_09455 [Candidatus Aenigmarchaeota archaeon]|nr:hypothetical protein [Candidatus Aenigmarchaeota archaeon]
MANFNDVHDVCRNFNIHCMLADALPETRAIRQFQQAERYPIFLAYYVDSQFNWVWDENAKVVKINRLEIHDAVHELFQKPGALILPRRNAEIEKFSKQVCNLVKVLQEDPETGAKTFKYLKTGEDHGRHSLAYCLLASERISLSSNQDYERPVQRFAEGLKDYDPFNY